MVCPMSNKRVGDIMCAAWIIIILALGAAFACIAWGGLAWIVMMP